MARHTLSTPLAYLLLAATFFTGALAATVDSCPGYKASNVEQGNGKLTADLALAGEACDVYGQDLPDLRLLVEYQTSRLHEP